MKPTDFGYCLSNYLISYLPGQKNLSPNTIKSYRDTYKLLLSFMKEKYTISPERLTIKSFDRDSIDNFLVWLELGRGNSISTRNQRLAAIHALFRYIQSEMPEHLLLCQRVLAMPSKRNERSMVSYLTVDTLQAILSQPDTATLSGRRDLVLLSVLYDTGARVQELIDLIVRDIRLDEPAIIRLTGKGRKIRHVPILKQTVNLLNQYLQEQKLLRNDFMLHPVFFNRQHKKLTRAGVSYILTKYADRAGTSLKITPHVLRHTKAMHLLQANVNLIYIRDLLGHAHINTTEIYARADTEMKRNALEKANSNAILTDLPSWQNDKDLISWLQGLCKLK